MGKEPSGIADTALASASVVLPGRPMTKIVADAWDTAPPPPGAEPGGAVVLNHDS